MDKPFKSVDEQIEILHSRGLQTDRSTRGILLREGYYSVINGYKVPFIDAKATREAGDDRYIAGAEFLDVYSLFQFDRELRELTFHYVIKAEALVRTLCSYTFSEANREKEAYLRKENFSSRDEFEKYGLIEYDKNLGELIRILRSKRQNSKREFVTHYRKLHDNVPLWVLANDLTFGNVQHFYNLMKPKEQRMVCKRVVEATEKLGCDDGYFDTSEARVGLDVLVDVRNRCAHDERLYSARFGGRKAIRYVDFLYYIKRYLTHDEFDEMADAISQTVGLHSNQSAVVSHILSEMGFREVC